LPLYQCISPEGLLDDSVRENIAAEITRIHCNATGAPAGLILPRPGDEEQWFRENRTQLTALGHQLTGSP
jgi:hypothetical protein